MQRRNASVAIDPDSGRADRRHTLHSRADPPVCTHRQTRKRSVDVSNSGDHARIARKPLPFPTTEVRSRGKGWRA